MSADLHTNINEIPVNKVIKQRDVVSLKFFNLALEVVFKQLSEKNEEVGLEVNFTKKDIINQDTEKNYTEADTKKQKKYNAVYTWDKTF